MEKFSKTKPRRRFKKKVPISKPTINSMCSNCGNHGHRYQDCKEPITSIGLMAFKIANIEPELTSKIVERIIKKSKDGTLDIRKDDTIPYTDFRELEAHGLYSEAISVVVVRRKHSLGYLEFMRGRYKIDNVTAIMFLFQQMTKEEIDKIKDPDNSFDDLAKELRLSNTGNYRYHNAKAKEQFEKLRKEEDVDLGMPFYVEVPPLWKETEWGFPKGRRNTYEDSKECAIREFREETSIPDKNYYVLEAFNPKNEEFIGTNGLSYRHTYYTALLTTDDKPDIDPDNDNQVHEIGAIGMFDIKEATRLIRPYHMDKKRVLNEQYLLLLDTIIKVRREILDELEASAKSSDKDTMSDS